MKPERVRTLSKIGARSLQRVPIKGIEPEMAPGSALHRRGSQCRPQWPTARVPRPTIDVAIPALKIAVFIGGCFWRDCPVHDELQKISRAWRREKIKANRELSRDTDQHSKFFGLLVPRFLMDEGSYDAQNSVATDSTNKWRAIRKPLEKAKEAG